MSIPATPIPVSVPTITTTATPLKKRVKSLKKTLSGLPPTAGTTSAKSETADTSIEDVIDNVPTLQKIEAAKPVEETFCFTCYNGFSCHTHKIKRSNLW